MLKLSNDDAWMNLDLVGKLDDPFRRVVGGQPPDERVQLLLGNQGFGSRLVCTLLGLILWKNDGNAAVAVAQEINVHRVAIAVLEVSHFMEQREPKRIEPVVSKRNGNHGALCRQPERGSVNLGPWKRLDDDESNSGL